MTREPNHSRGRAWRLLPAAALALLLAGPVGAVSWGKGELSFTWDTTISWGAQYRLDNADPALIGLANGGDAFSVNGDDGNQNYDTGIFSNVLKLTTEMDLRGKSAGVFVRFRTFYDEENEDGDRLRTPLSEEALERVGSRADFLDAFVWKKFNLGSRPAEIRFGEQVLSWGESTFIQGGINAINPIDVSAIRVPGAELRDALLPEGMVSLSFGTSLNTSFELFYLYDWGRTRIDPAGSYWSTNDFAGRGGDTVFLGFGDSSDMGTFPLSDRPFLGVPREPDRFADESGQYGAALRVFAPGLNDTEFGFYFMNYHSRLPTINGRTGTLAGALKAGGFQTAGQTAAFVFLQTFAPNAAISAGTLAGINAGLTPVEATIIAQATVGTLAAGGDPTSVITAFATDAFAQTARYFLAYPEDIKYYGISFNAAIGTWAWQGEISHKQDAPLQVDDVELLFAALGGFNQGLALANQVGNFFGRFETEVPGIRRVDVSQFQMTLTKVLGPTLGADQGVFLFEGAVTQADLPSKDELRFEGPATYVSGNPLLASAHAGKPIEPADRFADDQSWGYRLAGRLDYLNAVGGFNVSPRFAWQHDVEGISPGPGGNFIEDRTALTLGLGFNRQNTWQFDLSYTTFSGGGRYNLISDRDFIGTNIKYSF
ncbi:MAG: DUF1302 domain-containing protein [Thermoanaerobaculia bacterium]